ncbi:MAG: AIDA repeat-containing protein, partial [Victivallales bacterium]|nr:AIDA repeat-containing protein [Victivallales bacterium]
MPTTQLYTRLDSGIMTVLPEGLIEDAASHELTTVPQVVYLDFDGAVTSYHNRDLNLTIDDIVVEDSGFDATTISCIVATLNEQFGEDIVFTSELPEEEQYSTIYIGVTSVFDEYGSFLGLAETVDSGNLIRDDNAFVFLNSTAATELVTSVIAHEAQHLVGTLEHDGEGIKRYADGYIYYYILNNQTFTGILDYHGLHLYRESTGKTIVSSSYRKRGGDISSCIGTNYVSANNVTVNSGGRLGVSSGGTANHTTVNSGGRFYVYSGGTANHATVSSGGFYVYSGGTANHTTVNSGGWLNVYSGGTANH